jgi:hypothetical protein
LKKIIEVSSDTNIGGAGKCLLTLLSEYDRNKYEQQSREILEGINIENISGNPEDNTTIDENTFLATNTIRIEDDILKVLLGGATETEEEVKLGNILKDVNVV